MENKIIRKHYKRMNGKDFEVIKFLLQNNINSTKIKELTGRGSSVISGVKIAKNFAEYLQTQKQINDKYRERREAESNIPDVIEKDPGQLPLSENRTAIIINKLDSISRALQLINDRLDELEKLTTEKQDKSRFWNK